MKTCHVNILETGTVTLSAGTADASYPLYRLYDRGIGRMFKTTAAITTEVMIDQGASGNLAIDRLLIPSGHNLAGMTLDIKWSDNDSSYTTAVAQWTGAAGIIDKSWTSITHRYWKFIITSPGSIPQIPELFLTQTYTWERDPVLPTGDIEPLFNVDYEATTGGQDRFLVNGPEKKQRNYSLKCLTAQKDNFLLLYAAWAGAKPFYLYDPASVLFYCRITDKPALQETQFGFQFTLNVMEVIP